MIPACFQKIRVGLSGAICVSGWVIGLILSFSPMKSYSQNRFRVMEYNVENLFDCEHDTLKNDLEFMPGSVRKWTSFRYWDKLLKIARVIVAAGEDYVPDLVALCEVENDRVVRDLIGRSPLRETGYRYVMTSSPDQRGIDVALLYQPGTFRLLESRSIRIPSSQINRPPTRDILHVTGKVVTGDTLDVFVCHMPSRSGGQKESEPYRFFTASILKEQADSVMRRRVRPHLLLTGDFNDYPTDASIMEVLGAKAPFGTVEERGLYNLMAGRRKEGTYRYRGKWGILDQMIVSGLLLSEQAAFRTSYEQARILAFPFLLMEEERYGGAVPFRTYWGVRYQGGYSDHLPILLELSVRSE